MVTTPSACELLAQYDALKLRSYELVDPQQSLADALEDVIRALVNNTQIEVAQPAVAETPAAVAAPEAPQTAAASNGASSTPEAAGTAPEQPQVQG